MAETITITMQIELPERVTDYSSPRHAAWQTLCDALAEFEGHRRPISSYLDRRYPPSEGYEWLNRERKAKQLEERIFLARAMRGSIVITPEEE